MRCAALDYSRRRLASWAEVLAEDLFSLWQPAAEAAGQKLSA
jgi:hypothetical protein